MSDNRSLIIAEVSKIDTTIGERCRIVYVDPTSLLRGSRLADAMFADVLKPGEKVDGKILKTEVKEYTFVDTESGEQISATVAPIVQLGDESLEQAIKNNGKQMPSLKLDMSAITESVASSEEQVQNPTLD